jgi:hypothetical protein
MIEGGLHLAREMPDAGLLRKFPARRHQQVLARQDESAADLNGFRGALLVLPDLSGGPLFSPG